MRSLLKPLVTMAALALGASAAGAQTREGIFVGVGAGWGSARVDADEFAGPSDRQGDITGHLRVGTTLGERLLVGAELNAWRHSEQGDKATLFDATAAFYFYPAGRGLFVKGGAGVSRADFGIGGETVDGIGWGLMGGLGYDIPIGRGAAITPVATFWFGKPGTLKFENIDVLHNFRQNVVEIGVGITFY